MLTLRMRVWVASPGKPLRVALMVAEDKETNGVTRRGDDDGEHLWQGLRL